MKRASSIVLGFASFWMIIGCSARSDPSGIQSLPNAAVSTQTPTPSPVPPGGGASCGSIVGAPYLEVPAPGATGVPVNIGAIQIYLAGAQSLSLATSAGADIPVGPLVAATPPPNWQGLPTWHSASVSQQLPPSTTFVVTANVYQPCFGYTSHYNIGSFTTSP